MATRVNAVLDLSQLLHRDLYGLTIVQEPKAIGQELIQGIPDEKQGWQVSEADTNEIAKILGTWWEKLAAKLHFENEVDNIKAQYINDLEMQKYQLLLRWNYRDGSKATYRVILNHLCDLEQIDCLDEVCKLLRAQSEPGSPLLSALARYSDDLKCAYSNHEYQTVVDWPPPLYGNFMRLAMISEQGVRKGEMDPQFIGQITQGNVENILKRKTPIQLCEIFDKTKGNVVLLEGAPGSGKTTLCWYICQEWGRGKLFQQFTHILMVELRDEHTQSAECLADILPYCEGEEANRIAGKLKEKNGENVLVILEGWDQLHEKKRKKSIFKCLIEKGTHCPLHKAVILISSRSSVCAGLAKTRVEILGFTPDQISQYVQASFGEEVEKAAGLLIKIRQNPRLQGTCYFPLNLMLIVHLYSIDQQLPESFCSVIIQLVLTCLYRYRRNKFDLEDNFDSFYELPDDIKPQFLEICKLAFEATIEERHSFSNLTTDHLGLMQSVQSIAARGNKMTQYFLHSSLQELCAAIHISTQPIPEQKRMLEMMFVAPKDYLLRFYSALTHWENASLCEVLFEHSEIIIEAPNISRANNLFPFLQINTSLLPNISSEVYDLGEYCLDIATEEMSRTASSITNVGDSDAAEVIEMEHSNASDVIRERYEHIWESFMNVISPTQGTNVHEFMKGMFEACMELFELKMTFLQEIYQPIEDIYRAFGSTDIPQDVVDSQLLQILQQKMMTLPIKENPQLQMGIPVSSQEQLAHNSYLMVRDTIKQLLENGDYLNFMKSFIKVSDSHTPVEYIRNTPTVQQQAIEASFADGIETHNMLMLIHCIYEARNPALAQILGPRLEIAGELNASDMIALQNVLEGSGEGGRGCNLDSLSMLTAIPPAEVGTLTKVIKRNSTIKELSLNIGCYDGALVEAVLSKPTINIFHHGWTMQDEEDCILSCKSFFSCLRGNQNLQVLELSYQRIHDHGAIELATVINTTRLVEINLTGCGIGEEGIKALSSALEYNNYLSILHLNMTVTSPAALKHLSQSLRHNKCLEVLGMFEDLATTNLTEANLEEFIMHLRFNSSLVYIFLNSVRLPPLQEAVAFVNRSRRAKHQPQLSIEDGNSQNHNPETYNLIVLQASVIIKAFRSINIVNDGGFPSQALPVQEWYQSLCFTLHFIEKSKAIRNMSMSQLLQPSSQMVDINVCLQKWKTPYSDIRQCELSSQEQQQTFLNALHFIEKSKAIRNMSLHLLQPRRPRDTTTVQRFTSQYPAVIKSLKPFTPQAFSHQEWQQTVFGTLKFIDNFKAVRNMCISQLLHLNCRTISIKVAIEKHKARHYVNIKVYGEKLCCVHGLIVKKGLQPECHEYVNSTNSLGLLLALIRGTTPDIDQVTHEHIHPLMQDLHQHIEVTIPSQLLNVVTVNGGSVITCPVSHNQSKIFSILLDILLYCISLIID